MDWRPGHTHPRSHTHISTYCCCGTAEESSELTLRGFSIHSGHLFAVHHVARLRVCGCNSVCECEALAAGSERPSCRLMLHQDPSTHLTPAPLKSSGCQSTIISSSGRHTLTSSVTVSTNVHSAQDKTGCQHWLSLFLFYNTSFKCYILTTMNKH